MMTAYIGDAVRMNRVPQQQADRFTKSELALLAILSLALSIRQVAMTMVMPFISVYSQSLSGYTPALAGMALGIFGLTQALFQIPFGLWSDKIGNKKVVLVGLLQVIIGLVMAYYARSIYWLIFARALQGSGAVIAVVFSWISSGLDGRRRLRAMSVMSSCIGLAAASSFAFGPLVHHVLPVNQMFLVCACIIGASWLLILIFLRDKREEQAITVQVSQSDVTDGSDLKTLFQGLLHNMSFVKLNAAAFFNNYVMVAVFFIVPQQLQSITGMDGMWKVFMPAVITALLTLKLSGRLAAKGYRCVLIQLSFLVSAIGLGMFNRPTYEFILVGCILFMVSYIAVSTFTQTLVNDIADSGYRGTVNGIFNSIQYLGSFAGSLITGALWGNSHVLALWFTLAAGLLGAAIMHGTYTLKTDSFKDVIEGETR